MKSIAAEQLPLVLSAPSPSNRRRLRPPDAAPATLLGAMLVDHWRAFDAQGRGLRAAAQDAGIDMATYRSAADGATLRRDTLTRLGRRFGSDPRFVRALAEVPVYHSAHDARLSGWCAVCRNPIHKSPSRRMPRRVCSAACYRIYKIRLVKGLSWNHLQNLLLDYAHDHSLPIRELCRRIGWSQPSFSEWVHDPRRSYAPGEGVLRSMVELLREDHPGLTYADVVRFAGGQTGEEHRTATRLRKQDGKRLLKVATPEMLAAQKRGGSTRKENLAALPPDERETYRVTHGERVRAGWRKQREGSDEEPERIKDARERAKQFFSRTARGRALQMLGSRLRWAPALAERPSSEQRQQIEAWAAEVSADAGVRLSARSVLIEWAPTLRRQDLWSPGRAGGRAPDEDRHQRLIEFEQNHALRATGGRPPGFWRAFANELGPGYDGPTLQEWWRRHRRICTLSR